MTTPPSVSIIVPCYNEENTIQLLLNAIYSQSYPLDQIEVVIADGISSDHTIEKINEFSTRHQDLRIRTIKNPKRNIPAGLNTALSTATGEIIVRLDAHSQPAPNYIALIIEAINKNLGDNVGGVWEILPHQSGIKPPGMFARGIAAAASNPIGVGDAQYRLASTPREVDTVPFGAFRKELINKVGLFNENLLTNEDYEFNYRIRSMGGKIWLDPAIRATYYSRPTIGALVKQYWRYGFWKARMLIKYPKSIRLRQVVPPLFALSIISLTLLAFFNITFLVIFTVEISLYLLILIITGIKESVRRQDATLMVSMPVIFFAMHFSWGLAFIWSLFSLLNGNNALSNIVEVKKSK